jgi:hypothetical protein
MDAETSGVVDEAGVARDDVVSLDVAEAERVGPVGAAVLQGDRRSIGGAIQDDPGIERAATQWLPTNLLAGGQHVPTVVGMDSGETAAGGHFQAHSVCSGLEIEG